MKNNYFQYLTTSQLILKYREAIEALEQELENNGGEITSEIEEIFKQIEQDGEILAWEILQLQDEIENDIKTNKERIENLEKLNISLNKQDKYLDGLLSILVKENGKLNKSANHSLKVGERNITLQKNVSYEVLPEFNDSKFIRYSVKGKITEENAKRIEVFLQQKGEEGILEKQILKKELNQFIKDNEEIPSGVNQIVKQTLYKR